MDQCWRYELSFDCGSEQGSTESHLLSLFTYLDRYRDMLQSACRRTPLSHDEAIARAGPNGTTACMSGLLAAGVPNGLIG
jgi:hypothetical protein